MSKKQEFSKTLVEQKIFFLFQRTIDDRCNVNYDSLHTVDCTLRPVDLVINHEFYLPRF